MQTVTIVADKKFYSLVNEHLSNRENEFLEYFDKEVKDEGITYTAEDSDNDFVYKISDLLTDCIIRVYEDFLLNRIVVRDYVDFSALDRGEIINVAKEIIDGNDSVVDKIFFIKRKNYIYKRLVEFLSDNEIIRLEGFIYFRLKDYKKDLELILEKAVEVYLTEKEYNEFINLLKYFIEVQEPKIDVVYLTIYNNGDFRLCDKFDQDVSYLYIDDMREEFLNSKLSKEDILLGALITISPTRIVLNKENEGEIEGEIFNTIKSIFNDRISINNAGTEVSPAVELPKA